MVKHPESIRTHKSLPGADTVSSVIIFVPPLVGGCEVYIGRGRVCERICFAFSSNVMVSSKWRCQTCPSCCPASSFSCLWILYLSAVMTRIVLAQGQFCCYATAYFLWIHTCAVLYAVFTTSRRVGVTRWHVYDDVSLIMRIFPFCVGHEEYFPTTVLILLSSCKQSWTSWLGLAFYHFWDVLVVGILKTTDIRTIIFRLVRNNKWSWLNVFEVKLIVILQGYDTRPRGTKIRNET